MPRLPGRERSAGAHGRHRRLPQTRRACPATGAAAGCRPPPQVARLRPVSRRPDGGGSVMTQDRVHPEYGHGLLVHHDDDELVEGTRRFVRQGLASGGNVVVRGPRDRVDTMREVLGVHPRLTYGFGEDAYLAPTRALFGYQKLLAESPDPTAFWVTGPVPLGDDSAEQAAWARYESAVDEALCSYPFRALCTYDTRKCPASVITAARATHCTISDGVTSRANPEYVDPSAFLANP